MREFIADTKNVYESTKVLAIPNTITKKNKINNILCKKLQTYTETSYWL